ncbi:MAG: DUF2029 domain-containing protein [Bacteroidia bacterium]|jgi:hypothetical protein|nr:DUF2029 domain-containing protein [Bacteroidia bacterium]
MKVNSKKSLDRIYKLLFNHLYEGLSAVIIALLIALSATKAIGDFGNYYYGSLFLLDGSWGPWVFDTASFNLKIYELGQRNYFLDYTPVPPFSALLYIPFVFSPIAKAKLLWNIINGILLLLIFKKLYHSFNIPKYVLFSFFILLIIPLRNNFYEGQSYVLICFLLLEGLLQYLKGKTWIMALTWAICIHLKISPIIVVFFLLFNQSYKALLYLLSSVSLIFIISIPFVGSQVWIIYLTEILTRLANGEINNPYALNYQSMQVLLKTLFVSDSHFNPQAAFHAPWLYDKLVQLFKLTLMLFGIAFTVGQHSKQEKFAIWILILLLVSGYGNSFSLLFLLFPLTFFYEKFLPLNIFQKFGIVILFLIVVMPFYWFQSWPFPFRFLRLYSLLAILIILYRISEIHIYKPLFLVVIFIFFIPTSKHLNSGYNLLNSNSPLLVYDFSIEGHQLKLNYFDFNGPNIKLIKLPYHASKTLVLSDTVLSWRRVKRICVNDSEEYFLSDQNRGVGFYTIYKTKCSNNH